MIQTSYFGNIKKLNGLKQVSIAAQTPNWFTGERELDFAPSFQLVYDIKKNRISKEEYRTKYFAELDRLDKDLVSKKLKSYYEDNSVFLCYERPDDFCHRHLFAEWVKENFKFDIIEWQLQ